LEYVGDQSHGRRWRENVCSARHVFLEDVVLDGAAQLTGVRTLAFCHRDVHRQQNRRRGVDGHRRRNLVEGNLVKELLHVTNGRNRNAHLPHLALRDGVVRIISDLGR
jgi:hypothetical protein